MGTAVVDVPVEARNLLESFPFFAMVLDEHHHVVMANTWFAMNLSESGDACPLACFAAVHHTDAPPEGCPLVESIRTGEPTESVVHDDIHGRIRVGVYPIHSDDRSRRLFLHLVYPE